MLGASAAILLCLLPLQASGLLTAEARCLPDYAWLSTSVNQSACDVAVELASVCYGRTYQLYPLPRSYVYFGPTMASQNGCFCSSVYYSMLSACAFCQGGAIYPWSYHRYNCTRVYLTVYPEEIPVGVKVPAYAYQDVVYPDAFNVSSAYTNKGVESSRALPSSTLASSPSASASESSDSTTSHSPAMIGGVVVGGLVGLALIAALITFIVLRSKKKSQSLDYNPSFQQSSNMVFTPDGTTTLIRSTISPPPGSPGSPGLVNPIDQSTYPSNMDDPYRQHSPPLIPNMSTGNSIHSYVPPQTMPQNPGGQLHYW